jgi:predicted Zn-dependent protease with MMP-like domain
MLHPMSLTQLINRAEKVVAHAQNALPPEIRALAKQVPVSYRDWPDDEILDDEVEADILGLFVGNHHGIDGGADNAVPPQIFLFLENIYDEAEGEPQQFDQEVRITYLHELGHYLGWGEDEVEARGL